MTMQVKCPNAACGKVLTVQEEYAGKKGKCPACGDEMTIPRAPATDRSAAKPTPEPRPQAAWARDLDPAPVLAASADPNDNEYALAANRPSGRSPAAKPAAGFMTRAGLAVGVCAVLFLAFSPRMEWTYLSKDKKSRGINAGPFDGRADLQVYGETAAVNAWLDWPASAGNILNCSLAVAVLGMIALMLTTGQQRDLADGAIAGASCAAVGWGVLAGIWQLAIVWKIFSLATSLREPPFRSGNRTVDTTLWPGPGLALGLLAALLVVLVFGTLLASRKRFLGLVTAIGVGFVVGFLLVVLHIQPWQDLTQ